jgi:hypothetical protein
MQNQDSTIMFIFLATVIFVILLKIIRDQHIALRKFQIALGEMSYKWVIKTVRIKDSPYGVEKVFDTTLIFLLISLKIKQISRLLINHFKVKILTRLPQNSTWL